MGTPIVFDKRWSLPTHEEFLREYMSQAGCDIPSNWDVLGEIAVLAHTTVDPKVKFHALREIASYTKIKPRMQDPLAQPVGGIKPLHVGLAEDVLVDAEYEEIEEAADAEFSEYE